MDEDLKLACKRVTNGITDELNELNNIHDQISVLMSSFATMIISTFDSLVEDEDVDPRDLALVRCAVFDTFTHTMAQVADGALKVEVERNH